MIFSSNSSTCQKPDTMSSTNFHIMQTMPIRQTATMTIPIFAPKGMINNIFLYIK